MHLITKRILSLLFLLGALLPAQAQRDHTASQIQLALRKLNTLGTVLYLAAHPDDENTRLISYMVNEKNLRTGYLSLTRGDGGQNLIGTEKGALMGLLRTNELMEARKIDGGEQFFTRAVDYGYSKNPEEAFTKWDRNQVLADVVWTIRKFRPDVIVTRFPPNARAGHGHHTASAILAEEAFDLAADSKAFPEQLAFVQTWQTKRLFFNNSSWWDKNLPEKAAKGGKFATLDVGIYNPLLGKSYSEVASESRSMHKSQGFGAGKQRGEKIEYLELVKGDPAKGHIFAGIDQRWNRIPGGAKIGKVIAKVLANFQPADPAASVSGLAKAHALIQKLPDGYWKKRKRKEIEDLILACAGLWLEATANQYSGVSGESANVTVTMVRRSKADCKIKQLNFQGLDSLTNLALPYNERIQIQTSIKIAHLPSPQADGDKVAFGYNRPMFNPHPYWLMAPFDGMYQVADQSMIGRPLNPPSIIIGFDLDIEGAKFRVNRPLMFKWTDRVKGELYRSFAVLPQVTANIAEKVYIFSSKVPQKIVVSLQAHTDNVEGNIFLNLPPSWQKAEPSKPFSLKRKDDQTTVSFRVSPPAGASKVGVSVSIGQHATEPSRSLVEIEYDHIQTQTLLPAARSTLVKLDVARKGKTIGYIVGAGDEVPQSLQQLGYEVKLLDEAALRNQDLSSFDAILAGIRAYNTQDYLKHVNAKLLEYVKNGGNYIVQYNTNRGLVTEDIGPYPFKLSRDRVTVEEAPVTFLAPKHPVLNSPNKITKADFSGWIQERGLYFPNEWDAQYTPILGWNDPGEDMTKGSLLVANYGKGAFIYTGISFFRELPAGVPGAYKLIANMISYGK
ncbi:MAG TPA: PIG-L family deacetylase [Bacteroidetes bacterium]|nr:PIG-L family deacetylase [Bacteroidota bacterium]